ncbi:MAG: hypothetical protein KBG17_09740 [Paludibacteraceae bacterium]|nr:hypothetical protein [Paludibacteraceae bacterium]
MKHVFTFLVMAFLFNAVTMGQATFVLDDFENGQVNFTEVVNVNPPAHMDIAVVDNPVKDAVNSSNKVWEWKRYDAEADNKIWAGFYSVLKNEIPSGYHRIEIKYLRKNTTSQLKIKLEGAVTKEIMPINLATKTNEWETLVFDIYAAGIKNIRIFGFFPDYYEPIDVNAIVYVDDITIVYDPTITPPPAPTSITLFENSTNDRFHDQSWSFKEGGSTLVQEHWQAAGLPDGDKLPCVTNPVKSAPNALKLQWKSVEGGNWGAIVASIDWIAHDVRQMTNFTFWVNSPVALAKTALPKLYFESSSGNPNKTGKLDMGNYVNDLAANTWTEVVIPLADFWAADAAFTSQEFIKGIFFAQNAADNVEHTLILDDFKFVKVTPGIVLFDNSADNRFYDQSWSTKTAPSTLLQEHWQGSGLPDGDKLPVVTSPVKDGANALKLQWKSAEGGSWMALVASIGWKAFDLSDMTHLQFWVNSPVTLTKELLPKVFLESHSGNPNKTGKLNLGNYVISLAANTWTEVRIPLADFYAADPAFKAKDVVKGIFFEQNTADNVEHTMYMDEFKFITVAPSEENAPIFIDFGSNNPALMTTGNWNNVTEHQSGTTNLIDEGGNATGIKLSVTDPFYNGYNTNGTSSPTGDAAIFVQTATSDNFFCNGAVWGSTPANPEGIITMTGLNPEKYYSFKIFASRTGVTNVREAKYTMTGLNTVSDTLNASNNISRIAEILNVRPTTDGTIIFKSEAGPNNNSAEKFFFLGAMMIIPSNTPTAVENITVENKFNAFYQNNTLRINNYTGLVKVYSVAGSLVAEGQSILGYMTVKLERGLYIVNTGIGNAKVLVK